MQKQTNLIRIPIFFILLFIVSNVTYSQSYTISGPQAVNPNKQYTYTVSPSIPGNYTWNVVKGLTDMYGSSYANITWTSTGTGTVRILNQNFMVVASLNVSIVTEQPLSGGSISNTSQTINYNIIPGAINTSAATGGSCSGNYSYQWQVSTDNSNFSDIGGATGQNYSPPALTATTYFRRRVNCNGATQYTTNTAVVNVYAQFQGGAVNPSSQTINHNTAPGALTLSGVSGGNGSYSYQWQESADNINFSNISGATGSSYSPGALTTSKYFRVASTSNGATAYSASAAVNVYAALQPGSISPSSLYVNYGTSPGQGLISIGVSGGNGSYTYQWQESTDNINFSNISGFTGSMFIPGGLTVTTHYRIAVTSNGVTAYSNSAVINVYPQLQAGTISPSSQTINYNTVPASLTSTGIIGGNGSYTYEWHSSSDGTTFVNVDGATGSSYAPGNLTTTTWYRMIVTSNDRVAITPNVVVNVYPQLQGGSVNPSVHAISYNTQAGTLHIQGVTGGNGIYTYQWQVSADGSNFSDIGGANGATYVPGNLIISTYYRVAVTSNGVTVYSGVSNITVMPPLTAGSINGSAGPISFNTSPGLLTGSIPTGGLCSNFVYQWQKSINGSTYYDIIGATSQNYTPEPLTVATFFRRKVSCGPEEQYSNVLLVQVNPQIFPGSITPDHLVIAAGTNPGMLTANAASGGACSSYIYQWQQSTDGLLFTDITGAAGQNYSPGNLSGTTYFRRKVTCGAETAFTNVSVIAIGTIASSNLNYIRTREITKPGITSSAGAQGLTDLADVKQATRYFDGLGRLVQVVNKQQSPLKKDLVAPVEYDPYGRQVTKYLPYVSSASDGEYKPAALVEQNSFNATLFSGEQFYYGQTDLELSPLNRVQKSYAPGQSWVGNSRGVEGKYWFNTTDDAVRMWDVTDVSNDFGTYSTASIYPANELYKHIIINEHGNQTITFTDKEGRIILKKIQLTAAADDGKGSAHTGWSCTYNLYDNLGNLRCVIQPKGVEIIDGGWQLTDPAILNEQCFRYEYDLNNRMIMKKVPGAGTICMVYDAKDRLVMTQDAKMHASGNWLVNLYDNLNRPVQVGVWSNSNDRIYHAGQAATLTDYPFSAGSVPASGYEMFTKTGYDDYTALPAGSGLTTGLDNVYTTGAYLVTSYNSAPEYAQEPVQSQLMRGLPTWTQIKVLGTVDYLYTVNIYDDKSRVIQAKNTNISGGTDIVTTQYTWTGKPLRMVQKLQRGIGAGAESSVIVTNIKYDDLGRTTQVDKKIGNTYINGGNMPGGWTTVARYAYNELGQLLKKDIGGKKDINNNYTGDPLQTLKYDYNIRGWLLGLNRDYLATQGQTSDGIHFGFELGYDKQVNKTGENFNASLWNGNITGMIWKSDGDDIRRKYDFTFDNINRLLKADFEQHNGDDNLWNNNKINYTVKMGNGLSVNSAYDANGNIIGMTQYGWKLGNVSTTPVDQLTYTYKNNYSNQLLQVTDAYNDNFSKLGDFKYDPATKTGADYSYDLNGNLIMDKNKSISGITYNHLNLPHIINLNKNGQQQTITYYYDATGNKLKKEVAEIGQGLITRTLYLGTAVFESKGTTGSVPPPSLQYIVHEEGRTRFNAAVNNAPARLDFDYFIKDHLGNIRMVLTEERKQHVYPAATLEGDLNTSTDAAYIEKDYYNIDGAYVENSTVATGIDAYENNNGNPPYNNNTNSNTTANSTKLYKLNATTNKTGLGITLKVMAGDQLNILGKSYWFNSGGNFSDKYTIPVSGLLDAFLATPGMAGKGITNAAINTGSLTDALTLFTSRNDDPGYSAPWAYINWIFFDEQFNYAGGGFDRIGSSGIIKDHNNNTIPTITVPKNGYVYVYCSNESKYDVFFDNLQVIHANGPILEETHYYPFGLTMAGISAKAIGMLENKYKFNGGNELNKDLDLNWYETRFRGFDPQTGRMLQIDPMEGFAREFSPYTYSGNNPLFFNDPLGLTWKDSLRTKEGDYAYSNNPDLAAVSVTHTKRAPSWGGFYWPKMHKNQLKWNDEMYARIRDKKPLHQKGDPAWLEGQVNWHKHNYKVQMDGRSMQLGAVALIGLPTLGASLAGTGAYAFIGNLSSRVWSVAAPKFQVSIAGGAADFFTQKVIQGKDWGDVNYATVLTNTFLGGRNIISSSLWESTGSFFTISANGSGFNFNKAGATDFAVGSVGNLFGNAWGGMFEFTGVVPQSIKVFTADHAMEQVLALPGEIFGNIMSTTMQ